MGEGPPFDIQDECLFDLSGLDRPQILRAKIVENLVAIRTADFDHREVSDRKPHQVIHGLSNIEKEVANISVLDDVTFSLSTHLATGSDFFFAAEFFQIFE